MKLLITQHNINERGGAEKVILKIAQKYDATIYTLGYDQKGTFEGFKDVNIHVFRERGKFNSLFPARVGNALHYAYGFYNLKIKEDYDVVNPHMSPSEWVRNNNPRALWYCHTPPREVYDSTVSGLRKKTLKEELLYKSLSKVYTRIEKGVVNDIETIATNSNTTANRINHIFHRKAQVINPAIDFEKFKNNGDAKYFLYPSRIAEQKRQEYAIEAFSRFRKMGKYTDYKLILAGSMSKRYTDFSKYYDKLKATKAQNVIFRLNPTDKELMEMYSKATAVLFSPINEDYGIVPLEGMASYKPVISVNEGGPTETIVDGKTGFLVNSPNEMANKMKFLVENKSISKEMGKAARKRIENNYSWKAFFNKFDTLARKTGRM
jgi:glycosyltransferase involved in cell wall biosynthesis